MTSFRRWCATLLLAGLPFLSPTAHGVVNAIDPVPGASVLYPYFEVDLANATGASTLMSLVNTSATATLQKVTIWSDWATPVITFNVYLTGYDVASWNMRDVIGGVLPQSASVAQDPANAISPRGQFSQDINFNSCASFLPPAPLGAAVVNDLRAALTGGAVTNLPGITAGTCVSKAYGDQVARGYVTVDTVNQCSPLLPTAPTYFTAETTRQNVLWGDYLQINPSAGTIYGDLASMLEASSAAAGASFTPGNYTFYGRLNGFNASDQREALASDWIVHGETDTSRLAVWRDPKTLTGINGVACGTTPGNQPLTSSYTDAVWFDSFAQKVGAGAFPMPLNSISLGSGAPLNLPIVKKLGFLALGLDHTTPGIPTVATESIAQSAVIVTRQSKGIGALRTGSMAFPLNQVQSPNNGGFSQIVFP